MDVLSIKNSCAEREKFGKKSFNINAVKKKTLLSLIKPDAGTFRYLKKC